MIESVKDPYLYHANFQPDRGKRTIFWWAMFTGVGHAWWWRAIMYENRPTMKSMRMFPIFLIPCCSFWVVGLEYLRKCANRREEIGDLHFLLAKAMKSTKHDAFQHAIANIDLAMAHKVHDEIREVQFPFHT